MSEWRVPLSTPSVRGNEAAHVVDAIEANEIAVGRAIDQFEREFAQFVETKYSVAVSNGTAAIHLALMALGIGSGDEVFAPDFTFVASVNPITYVGATPVLVDAETQGWGIAPDLVEEELCRRAHSGRSMPKAIVVAHVYGLAADIGRLSELCQEFGIQLIEDAAESLGAWIRVRERTRSVGVTGRVGCFSFNGNKILTTGGGGVVVTEDEAVARLVRHLSSQARTGHPHYVHDEIGHNYRMPNLNAAFGRAQLERIDELIAARRTIWSRYREAFQASEVVSFMPTPPWADASCWMSCILLPDQTTTNRIADALRDRLIEARPVWFPLHRMRPYESVPRLGGDVAEDLNARGLCIPSGTDLDPDDQSEVIEIILESAH